MSQVTRGGQARMGQGLGLALLLGLSGCAQSLTGEQVVVPSDSLTAQRILGADVAVPPLLPVPGNVWPEGEPERATLGSVDTPLRPDELQQPTAVPRANAPRAGRGSSTPPDLLDPGTPVGSLPQGNFAPPPIPGGGASALPPRREDGQVIFTPNGPAVTTGGGPGYSTYNTPGGGAGIAIPQGGTTTLLGPDGTVQQVPTPR